MKGIALRLRETASDDRYKTVAEKTGINSETVRRYMLGMSPPSVEFIDRFSRAYGVTLKWLFRGEEPRYAPEIEHHIIEKASLQTLLHAIARRVGSLERHNEVAATRHEHQQTETQSQSVDIKPSATNRPQKTHVPQ